MENRIRAITLDQPWASLIAAGAKRIETRHWPPPRAAIGKPLAIHAGKSRRSMDTFTSDDAFNQAVTRSLGDNWLATIPTGAVVAIATLRAAMPTGPQSKLPERDELLFGDYRPNRWMWMLSDIKALETPVPARGFQRVWGWEAPPEIQELIPPSEAAPRQQPLI